MKKIAVFFALLFFAFIFSSCEKKKSGNKNVIEIIVTHNQTSLENPYVFGINKFKSVLENLSLGTMKVVCHHGTLSENENELISMLDEGKIQLCVASPGFMAGIGVPEVDMFSLPYLFKSFDQWEHALDGEFGNELKEVILKKTNKKYRVMGYWTASVRDYYGKKPITTPFDLDGMTIRCQTSKVQVDFWGGCGAIPKNVGWGELYKVLKEGGVDSAENDYTNFMLKEHHKTPNGKFICETHHDFTTRLFLMSGTYYENLTQEQKFWIDQAAAVATEEERFVTYKMAGDSKEKCMNDGAIVTEFANMDIEAFKAIALPIQDKFAKDNNMTHYLTLIRNTN